MHDGLPGRARALIPALGLVPVLALLLVLGTRSTMGVGVAAATTPASSPIRQLEDDLHRMLAGVDLWPGYDPLKIPLAVYDGHDTWLLRHPAPPKEFRPRPGGLLACEGRHAAVVANSSALIGNVRTVTLLIETGPAGANPTGKSGVENGRPVSDGAGTDRTEADTTGWSRLPALVAREGFHVFQSDTGRDWGADESGLIVCPDDDPDLLARARLEVEMLRRSLASPDSAEAIGWARHAVSFRLGRLGSMNPDAIAYERGIENRDGTAAYVGARALRRTGPEFPSEPFGANELRRRTRLTGSAWAFLLDRFRPGWREGFGADPSRFLDDDARRVVMILPASPECRVRMEEVDGAVEAAGRDVAALQESRARLVARLAASRSWRLVIESAVRTPLWPEGFDADHVILLDGGSLLHTRFLRLSTEAGSFVVLGDSTLTEAAGKHPLYDGIRRATVYNLAEEPRVKVAGDGVTLDMETVTADFRAAEVVRGDHEIRIQVGTP